MARQKKDGERFSCYLRKDIVELLSKYSEETGIPKTVVVEKALLKYLNNISIVKEDKND